MDRNSLEPTPLFRHVLERDFAAGFHAFDLGEFGVKLADGHTYQWSVAIVRDPDRRSQDIVSLATLERTATPLSLAGDEPPVYQFANAGLWYDAIEALAPPPTTGSSRANLEALLEQVGLAGLD
jgi:hypothetical protein